MSTLGDLRVGREPRDRARKVAWTVTPGLRADGATYPELTCLHSPLDDNATVTGDGTELFVLELPRLS